MEKHMRKPFFDGGYAGSTPRMSVEDLQDGLAWVDDRFFPIRYEDEALPSVDWVLNVAKAAVLRSVCCYCNYLYDGPILMPYQCLTRALPVPYPLRFRCHAGIHLGTIGMSGEAPGFVRFSCWAAAQTWCSCSPTPPSPACVTIGCLIPKSGALR